MAKVRKGTSFEIEAMPLGEGLWMMSTRKDHIDARVAVKGFRQNVEVKTFDFKRFNVEAHPTVP